MAVRRQLLPSTAILLTTHLVAEAGTVADRVAVLSAGRIVADATPEVLTDQLPDRTSIVTRQPEDVLRRLLTLDPTAHGLHVVGASLEDAVATLGGAGDTGGTRPTSTIHHDRKDAA